MSVYRNAETVTLRRCEHCRQRYEFCRSTSKFCSAKCRVAWNRKQQRRSVHFKTNGDGWETPQDLFDELDREFAFKLDVCASPENAKCERYFTKEVDGLSQSWTGVCWMNPPYGRTIGDWLQKARRSAAAGATVVCLVPARTDTRWWHDHCVGAEVRFLKGRLRFGNSRHSAPFPSALVIMRPEPAPDHETPDLPLFPGVSENA